VEIADVWNSKDSRTEANHKVRAKWKPRAKRLKFELCLDRIHERRLISVDKADLKVMICSIGQAAGDTCGQVARWERDGPLLQLVPNNVKHTHQREFACWACAA
jgi:FKBP-type peptidyl-prolyl cis-trans isomerase (trigger factor)